MKSKLIASVILFSFINACAASKKASSPAPAAAQNENASAEAADLAGMEHCIDEGKISCFADVKKDGRTTSYTTDEAHKALLVNDKLADKNFQIVDEARYASIVSENALPKMVYSGGQIKMLLDNVDANVKAGGAGFAAKGKAIFGKLSAFGKGGGGKKGVLFAKIFAPIAALASVFSILQVAGVQVNGRKITPASPKDVDITFSYGSEKVEDKLAE